VKISLIREETMRTIAVIFPFDLFGSAGTGAGAQLLADALREMLDDNRHEEKPCRGQSYANRVHLREITFETLAGYSDWQEQGRALVREALKNGEFLLWLTGNHLGVLPIYEELGADTDVIQLDAHLDVYNLSDCTEEPSHGNYLMHLKNPRPRVWSVGHRDLFLPQEHVKQFYRDTFSVADLVTSEGHVLKELHSIAEKSTRLFLDLDCDAFDPSFFPAVTQPLPFGLTPQQFLRIVEAIWSKKVCGMSISEFNPANDHRDVSLGLLVWWIEWLLLKLYE
jgi:arginase family enzyme